MNYNIKNMEKTVAGLRQDVDEIQRLLGGNETHEFRRTSDGCGYQQRRVITSIKSGNRATDWENLPLVSNALAAMDWSVINFGYYQTGNVITVTYGNIWHGTRSRIEVAGDDITIAANQTWIWVEYPFGTGAATIESGTDMPVSTPETLKRALSLWAYDVGTENSALAELCWVSDIFLDGEFG